MKSGYIYALANDSMPGFFKIGMTYRNPFNRAKELHTTGIPTPFYVVLAQYTLKPEVDEEAVHSKLAGLGKRVSENREFFEVDFKTLLQTFYSVASDIEISSKEEEADHEDLFEEAQILHYGDGNIPPDIKKAIKVYESAATAGSIRACEELYLLYSQGKSVRKAPEKADFYLNKMISDDIKELCRCATEYNKIFKRFELDENYNLIEAEEYASLRDTKEYISLKEIRLKLGMWADDSEDLDRYSCFVDCIPETELNIGNIKYIIDSMTESDKALQIINLAEYRPEFLDLLERALGVPGIVEIIKKSIENIASYTFDKADREMAYKEIVRILDLVPYRFVNRNILRGYNFVNAKYSEKCISYLRRTYLKTSDIQRIG